ncbi:MAG: hypothetical protein HC817_06980, partial [Saprospiraceae bacterium]|nr:hypothetical protein [Saprospiraceae bacterium]
MDTEGVNQKPIRVGYEKRWGGNIYALDFYKKEVQDYLAGIFLTAVQTWQFDMFIIDGLYAACALPRPNKTRAQILHEILLFLKQLAGSKEIYCSQMPIGAGFGLTNTCRVVLNSESNWNSIIQIWLKNRESNSWQNSLRSLLSFANFINSGYLNEIYFFDDSINKNNLPSNQYETALVILILITPHLIIYDFRIFENETFKQVMRLRNRKLKSVRMVDSDVYAIHFDSEGNSRTCFVNLS